MPIPDHYFQFKNTAPYASELFGVYRPLVGWRARQPQNWVNRERLAMTGHVVATMLQDPAVQNETASGITAFRPDVTIVAAVPVWLKSAVADAVKQNLSDHINATGQLPSSAQWGSIIGSAQA